MNVSYQRVVSVPGGIQQGYMTEAKLNKRLKTFPALGQQRSRPVGFALQVRVGMTRSQGLFSKMTLPEFLAGLLPSTCNGGDITGCPHPCVGECVCVCTYGRYVRDMPVSTCVCTKHAWSNVHVQLPSQSYLTFLIDLPLAETGDSRKNLSLFRK